MICLSFRLLKSRPLGIIACKLFPQPRKQLSRLLHTFFCAEMPYLCIFKRIPARPDRARAYGENQAVPKYESTHGGVRGRGSNPPAYSISYFSCIYCLNLPYIKKAVCMDLCKKDPYVEFNMPAKKGRKIIIGR